MRPFSLKHAQQQASIVGHMQQAGLLKVGSILGHLDWHMQELLCVFISHLPVPCGCLPCLLQLTCLAMRLASNHAVPCVMQCNSCTSVQSLPCCHKCAASTFTLFMKPSMQNAGGRVYIEFGAGKGYLSSMLADASTARAFVLLDVRGFRNKADRCSVTPLSAPQPCHWSPKSCSCCCWCCCCCCCCCCFCCCCCCCQLAVGLPLRVL